MKKLVLVLAFLGIFTIGGSFAFADCPDCLVYIDNGTLKITACLPDACVQYRFFYAAGPEYPWESLTIAEGATCDDGCTIWTADIPGWEDATFNWMILCGNCLPAYCQGHYPP